MFTRLKRARVLTVRCIIVGTFLFVVLLILPLFSLRFDPYFNLDLHSSVMFGPSGATQCIGYACLSSEQLRMAFGSNVVDSTLVITICWLAALISFLLIVSGIWLLFTPHGSAPWLVHPIWLTILSLGIFITMIFIYLIVPVFLPSLLNTPAYQAKEAGDTYLKSHTHS